MWTIYSKQFDGNYLFLFTFSITALRILICASLQASQYKFLTEMIFCFLNLSLCEGGIVAPSQESERAHLHQSRRSCVAVLSPSPDISQQYIAAGPFIRKFLVFVDCEEAERRAIWCGLDTRSCWSRNIIIFFLLALTCLQLPKLICGFINCIHPKVCVVSVCNLGRDEHVQLLNCSQVL